MLGVAVALQCMARARGISDDARDLGHAVQRRRALKGGFDRTGEAILPKYLGKIYCI